VRDQATLIIDKVMTWLEWFDCTFTPFNAIPPTHTDLPKMGDASNRRWLSGAPEGATASMSLAEREALAQKERLSGVEGTIVRCVGVRGCGVVRDR
jgi:hypothetical protein